MNYYDILNSRPRTIQSDWLITELSIANLELGLRWLNDRSDRWSYWNGRFDGAVDAYYRSLPCAIELGLRWLNDRSKQHIFEQDSCGCETLHGIIIQCSKHYNQ